MNIEQYVNTLSNTLADEVPLERGTLYQLLEHIVNTDTRFKTKIFRGKENRITIIAINKNIIEYNKREQDKHKQEVQEQMLDVREVRESTLEVIEQVRLTHFKQYSRGYYIVVRIKGLKGYWLINSTTWKWCHLNTFSAVSSTIRLLNKDILPNDLSEIYKLKLRTISNENSNIFEKLNNRRTEEIDKLKS